MDVGLLIAFAAVVGVIALVVPLVLFFNKRNKEKYAQLWAPLATLINGSSTGNTMTGTYNGVPVQAKINAVSDSENSTEYFYQLTVTPGTQGQDWSLAYTGDKLLGMGKKSWHIKTKNEALKQRLTESGAVAALEQWGSYPEVAYKAKQGTLKYETKVNGMFSLPSIEQFQAQLELMQHLAQTNRQVNA